ncbi:crowded nuclei 2-like protein [Tanacetum coccineum]
MSATQETLKREEAAHFMAVSEVEKRADNLRKALEFEKRCRADLEKALREIDEENKQVQLRSQTKLAEANSLVAGIGDKAREVEEKMLQSAGDPRKARCRCERRIPFIAGRDAWEDTYSRHKEDLREWERKLHEGEERLCEGRRIINSREEKVNEIERSVKQKEKELDEAHNKIESSILESKRKEDDINKRLLDLSAREEQAETIKKNMEKKEKELLDLAEKLTAKERVSLWNLDAQKETLDSKRREFELEMEEKREFIENDMRGKLDVIKQKEAEINHKEKKLKKQEEVLGKKLERYNEKELEIEKKSKALKEKEKSYKLEVESLQADKEQFLSEIESLEALKSKTENIRNEITLKELHVKEEIESLKIAEEERATFSCLQSKLKDEREACRLEKEFIMKERDDLRNDRVKFEVEWEALDENRLVIRSELKEFNEQKENWERRQETELGKLEKEKHDMKEYIKRELEAVKLERDTFVATMKHEESLLVAKYDNEHRIFLHELEQRKRDLEADFQNKQTKMETDMQEKDRAFEEMHEKEISNINYLKEVIRKDLEEVKSERERIAEEKDKIGKEKTQIEENQLGMLQDIGDLDALRKKITEQGRINQWKETNYERSELHLPEVMRDHFPLPKTRSEINEKSEGILGNKLKSPGTGRLVSCLKRCTSVFKFPQERIEHEHDELPETPPPETTTYLDRKIETSNVQAGLEGNKVAQKEPSETANVSLDQSYMGSKNLEAPEDSQQSELKSGRRRPTVRKPKGGPRKSRSAKAVPADDVSIKIISEDKMHDSVNVNDGSPQASSYVSTRGRPTTRKRAHADTSLVSGSEMDGGDTEAHSGSVTTVGGGRRKGQKRLLQQHKLLGGITSDATRRNEDAAPQAKPSVNNRKKDVSGTQKGETAAAVDTDVASQDGSTALFKTPSPPGDIVGSSGVTKFVKNTEIIEEVNFTHESENITNNEVDDNNSDDVDDSSDDDGDEDDDGSELQPGEASICKKIWNFLST